MEAIKIRENLRQVKIKAEEIQLFKNSFVIVPYQVSGFIDYTNKGVSNEVVSPNDFETFKRVWTGNDACVITWKDSFKLVQNNETKELEQKWSLGETFLGLLQTNSFDNDLSKDESFSEYTSQQQINTITFRVDKYFEITDYYNFMFYKIPELSGSTLYRIESIEKDFAGLDLIGYVITFKTINQELANTGRARQQNIMPSAPGQGYLECIVKDKNWPDEIGKEQFDKLVKGVDYYSLFDRYITGNYLKTKNNPVKKVIVKALGNGIINSFSMTGRPASYNSMEFGATRKLFCKNFSSPSTPTLYRSQSSIQNYYASNFKMTLQYYKEFFTYLKDTISNINKFEYQGWIEYLDTIKSTNNNEGLYSDWFFNLGAQTTQNLYTYGVETTYKTKEIRNIDNFFFDNYWTTKNIKIAPLNYYSTLNYGTTFFGGMTLSLMSAFNGNLLGFGAGLALSIVGLQGMNKTLQQQSKFQGINGIVPKDIIDFNEGLYSSSERVPFNLFDNSTENKDNGSSMFFKSNTINMCFEAYITDSFVSDRVPNKKLNTINISQSKFENGDNILPNGDVFLLNGDATLENSDSDGFIIDNFQFCGIFNGELSVEFLDANGDVCWSGVYQSEAKWTDNQREIWTEKNTSIYGRENIFINEPVKYPKPIKPSWEEEGPIISEIKQQIGGDYYKNTSENYYDLKKLSWVQFDNWDDANFLHYKSHFRYCFNQFKNTPKTFIVNTKQNWNEIKFKYSRVKFSIVQDFNTTKYKIAHLTNYYLVNSSQELWSQNFNLNEIAINEEKEFNLNINNFSQKITSTYFADFMKFEYWSTLPYNYLTFNFKWEGQEDDFVNIIFKGNVTKLSPDLSKNLRTFTIYGSTTTFFGTSGDYYHSELLLNGEIDTRIYLKVEFLK